MLFEPTAGWLEAVAAASAPRMQYMTADQLYGLGRQVWLTVELRNVALHVYCQVLPCVSWTRTIHDYPDQLCHIAAKQHPTADELTNQPNP